MSGSARITVTLPIEQVRELKKLTDNVSGFVSEAAARQIRHHLLAEDLRRCQEEYGEFTEEEPAQARANVCGSGASPAWAGGGGDLGH